MATLAIPKIAEAGAMYMPISEPVNADRNASWGQRRRAIVGVIMILRVRRDEPPIKGLKGTRLNTANRLANTPILAIERLDKLGNARHCTLPVRRSSRTLLI
jgi:hypothetical protein